MNWEAIAQGAPPDNIAFARLSEDEQLETIREGLRWASDRQQSAPQQCYEVATAALHLLDAHGVADPVRRMECGVLLANSAQALGRPSEARLQYDKVLAALPAPSTRHVRLGALTGLALLLQTTDPEQAAQLFAEVHDAAMEDGDVASAASAAISRGSLQRAAGRFGEARLTYEGAIRELRTSGTPGTYEQATLARLCGNLANLLRYDFGCPAEAIDYYEAAIGLCELASERGHAARRYFQLVATNLAAGRHRAASDMMAAGVQRVQEAPEAFRGVLEEAGWLAGAPADVEAWARRLDRFESESSEPLDPEMSAALVAARVVTHARMGHNVEAIALARCDAVRVLPPSELRNQLGDVVLELASAFGCTGIYWNLEWIFENMDEELTESTESAYHCENATIWLLEQAKSIATGQSSAQEVEQLLARGANPYGLGSADEELPEWIGPVSARTREIYARLRAGYPNVDDMKRAFEEAYRAWNPNVPPERSEQLLRTCIHWADLISDPRQSIECRIRLAALLSLQPVTRDRYNEALRLLEFAGQLAQRLPTKKLRVHMMRADLLTQCRFADEATRLGEAATEARRAADIAEAHRVARFIPATALTLGNALVEYPYASEAQLSDARTLLEKGLAANARSDDEFMQSSLQNTLGMVLFKIGENSDSVERLLEAKAALLAAHDSRKHLGDDERELTTLANLLGALTRIYQLTADESATSDVLAATGRILQLHRQNPNAPRMGVALMTAAVALDKINDPGALEAGSAAIVALRASGPLGALAGCLSNVARMHLDAGNVREARRLAAEAIDVGEDLRRQGGDSRYRAELTATFKDRHRILDRALEELGAAPADRWREIERGTGRTILENLSSRYSEELPDHEAVRAVLRARLPPDTVILHLFRTYGNDLAAFLITSCADLEVRLARHRLPLLAFAQETGGGIAGRKVRLPRFMPEHGDEFTFQLSRLGSGLLTPALGELTDGVTRIVLVDDIFNGDMPWQAVPVRNGTPLGVSFEVVQVPSTTVLARLLSVPDRPIVKAAFVACDPRGSLRRHIDECRHAFRAADIPEKVVLTDTSRPVVRSVVRDVLDSVDLFHFAGHSVIVDGSPESSGLELSDGLLTIPELESAFQRSAPMLAFLSSCESGRADLQLPDAPTMSSAFVQAGTRAVVSAAWPVHDQVAATTAQLFYENLAREGQLGALRHAQRELRNSLAGVEWASFGFHGWPAS